MHVALQALKSRVPDLPARHVPRPRMRALLTEAAERPVTLVAAGAGWGKTVLLSEWSAGLDTRVVWLSLDEGDNSAEAFWGLFWAALQHAGLGADEPATGRVSFGPEDALDVLHTAVLSTPVTLVLDDAHVLTAPEVVAGVDLLLRRSFVGLSTVLAARSDPLLPLHRYRVDGRLAEMRAVDVALDDDEIDRTLRIHGVRLDAGDRAVLAERTQGWAAGVRLSALRMEQQTDPAAFVTELALDRGSVGEYLTEEVLTHLDRGTRRLLLRTSVVDAVDGSLADALTGGTDGARALRRLADTNSFVGAVETGGTWYRVHPLLRELLRNLLDSERRGLAAEMHRRASRWFERDGRPVEAVRHALLGQDWSGVAGMLNGPAFEAVLLRPGRVPMDGMAQFVEVRPQAADDAQHRPVIIAAAAAVSAVMGDRERAADLLDALPADADVALPLVARLWHFAGLLVAHAHGDLSSVRRHAAWLATAGRSEPTAVWAATVEAEALFWSDRAEEAAGVAARTLARARLVDDPASALRSLGVLVLSATAGGEMSSARQFADDGAQLALLAATAGGGHPEGRRSLGEALALLEAATAQLALMTGDVAEYEILAGRAADRLHGSVDRALVASLTLSRAQAILRAGDPAQAWALLQSEPYTDDPGAYQQRRGRQQALADIMLELGRPRETLQELPDRADRDDRMQLTAAEAHLQLGEFRVARDLVRRVLAADPAPRLEAIVQATVLTARLDLAAGDESGAVGHLDDAIQLAAPSGFRSLRRPTPDVVGLLQRHPLLAAHWPGGPVEGSVTARIPAPSSAYHEKLTDRELSVLRWLTTSMSTAEIADQLCVSVNTVKTHIASVYRKLGAGKRRDAVMRARDLQLI